MDSSSEIGLNTVGDFTPTHSSKLSLGSSPSVLSGDEGEETIRTTDDDKDRSTMVRGGTVSVDDQDPVSTTAGNKEQLFNGSLELSTEELDDINMDQDSASPLSSVPEDFPLSRSASPEIHEDNPLLLLSSISVPTSHPSSLVEDWTRECKDIDQNNQDVDNVVGQPCSSRRTSTIEKGQSATDIKDTNEMGSSPTRAKVDNSANTAYPVSTDTSSHHDQKEEPQCLKNLDNVLLEYEEKENTSRDRNYANSLEDLENISAHEEDWDTQQRHKDALEALTHIEVEFARLREKMYQEKMAKLNEEAIMIANGTHPELVALMAEIEEKKGRRISTAEAWRKYQHGNFRRQFEGFEYQANVHFISRKSAIRRELLASTNGKRWRLEDEQGKLNDSAQRSGKLIPDAHTLGAQKQVKRKKTMDLQDIKDVIGFPRAPQVPGLSQQDIQDDLLVLGLSASRNK